MYYIETVEIFYHKISRALQGKGAQKIDISFDTFHQIAVDIYNEPILFCFEG